VKFKILAIAFFIPFLSMAQERGIGIRVGEPFSITYKDFISDYISVEGMIGSAGVNGASYYQRDFTNNPPTNNSFYIGHSVKKGLSLNARAAYHEDFTDSFGITQGYLLAYGGAGVQFRTTRVNYTYSVDQISGTNQQEERVNADFGPEAFIGSEYYFSDLPMNVFAEFGLFVELLDRVGHMKAQGGVGVRYLF
jgi:hypothetical protein